MAERTTYRGVERVRIPASTADLARRRCWALLVASVHAPNVLDDLIVSCYLQGLADGADVQQRASEKS